MAMGFEEYCSLFERLQFPGAGAQEHPERDAVQQARHALASAVVDDDFLAGCMRLELDRIEKGHIQPGLTPFFTIQDFGVRFAFGYWPPGATAGPHEHTAWTITAVCRNELEVFTFDRDASYRSGTLVTKNRFEATAGRTGFIYEPCIHEPLNPTRDWSLSLHVLSPRDGEKLTDYDQCIPTLVTQDPPMVDANHPYAQVLAARRRYRFVRLLARILATMETAQASALLAQCFRLGSPGTRNMMKRTGGAHVADDPQREPWLLARAHPDLVLSHHVAGDLVVLNAETPGGTVEELAVGLAARDALATAVREPVFDVRALPGNLADDERAMIAETLEETGLFRRVSR